MSESPRPRSAPDRLLGECGRRPALAWCVATLPALALAWRRLLAGSNTPYTSDIEHYHYPVTRELVRAWSQGRIPLWSDHVYLGFPFFADPQTAAWYPATPLVAWLGPGAGYTIFLFLHSLLACAGTTALARAHGVSWAGGWGAGLVVALSGFFAVEAQHPGLFAILCWVPTGLWTLQRVVSRPTPDRVAIAAIVMALMIFAGTLQVLFGVAIVYGFYLSGLVLDVRGERGMRRALASALAAVASQLLGLALAAVVLLPAAAHLPRTARALGMTYAFGSMGSVHPLQLLGAFVNTAEQQLGSGADLGFGGASLFMGGLVLPLALVGLLHARGALRLALTLGVVFCGLLVLGRFGWLHPWLHHALPGSIGSLRGVGRAVGPAGVALALLAGLGVRALARGDARAGPTWMWLLGAMLACHGLVGWGASELPSGAALGSALVLLAALAASRWLRKRTKVLELALVGLLALDLLAFGPLDPVLGQNPEPDAVVIGGVAPALEELVAAPQQGGPPRTLLSGFGPRNLPMLAGVDGVGGYNPLVMLRYLDLAFLVNQGRAFPRTPLERFVHSDQPQRLGARFDAAAIDHVVSLRSLDGAPGLELVGQAPADPASEAPLLLYRNRSALPRAYLSRRSRRVASVGDYARWMGEGFDARGLTLVEGDAPELDGPAGITRVERMGSRPERLRFEVEAEGRSLLVVGDSWYPGWRAWVDGVETPVLRANVLFRAVEVPAGGREVEMRFEPASFRAGAVLSMASAVAIAALLALAGRRAGRR